MSGSHRAQILRAAAPTDGAVLPAIVSPDLAEDVDDRGILLVQAGDGTDLSIRPVATARFFPTMTELGRNLVIVDGTPLATALNADAPGRGGATDMLVRSDDPAVVQAVAERLDTFGFPSTRITVRADIEAAQARDPFALGVAWSLAVGAIAGIALSAAGILLALRSRLHDDRGDLGELEEQGLAPATLARLAVLQTLLVAVVGIAVGAALGLGLGWLTAASIAVGGSGASPMPPLQPIAPWPAIGLVVALVFVGLALSATIVARRHFSGSLPGEAAR